MSYIVYVCDHMYIHPLYPANFRCILFMDHIPNKTLDVREEREKGEDLDQKLLTKHISHTICAIFGLYKFYCW